MSRMGFKWPKIFLSLLLAFASIGMVSNMGWSQSVSSSPNSLTDTVDRTDITTSNLVSLANTTTLTIVQTAPWTVKATVTVAVPATGTATASVEDAFGIEDLINSTFVFPAGTSTSVCNNTSGCTNIDFRLDLDRLLNGASGTLGSNSYTFTVTFSLRDSGDVEVATDTFTFEVALGDIVGITVTTTPSGDTTIDRSNFGARYFTLGSFDISLAAVTDYQISASVDFTGTVAGILAAMTQGAAIEVSVASFANADAGETPTLDAAFSPLNTFSDLGTSLTSLFTGTNTVGGASTSLSATANVRLDLDALNNNTTSGGGGITATITVRILET